MIHLYTRRAVSLVELSIAFLVLSLAIVPLVGLFTGGRSQAQMSEHQIYAELAAYRALEDHATRHFGWLARDGTKSEDMFPQLIQIDKDDGTRNKWWDQLTEFQKNAWSAQIPLKGQISQEVANVPGKAMVILKSSATWSDLAQGHDLKQFSYHLLRLRTKRDYGLRSTDAEL